MPEDDLITRIQALTAPLTPEPTGLAPRIEPLTGIRAVLFDVYGTLVISGCGDIGLTSMRTSGGRASQDRFHVALARTGIDSGALPEHFDGAAALVDLIGASHDRGRARGVDYPEVDILAVWGELLARLGIAADESNLRQLAVEYEFRANAVWPMPACFEVIQSLLQRGLVLGIVSNAQFYTPLMLAAFRGRNMEAVGFDTRCCAWSYRYLTGKPSLRVYEPALAALQRHHGIAPEQVLYVGNDLRNDIWPASRLGCRTALFAGDARSLRLRADDARLRGLAPDRVLTSLEQLTASLLRD